MSEGPQTLGKKIKQPGPAKHWTCWYHLELKSPRSELPPQECCGLCGGVNPGFIKLWHWKIPKKNKKKSMEVLMAKFIYKGGIFQQAMFDCRRVVCLNESTQVCLYPGMAFAQCHCLSIPPTCFFPHIWLQRLNRWNTTLGLLECIWYYLILMFLTQ